MARNYNRRLPTVHPRVRGEHATACFWGLPAAGSSPRARGTPSRCGPKEDRHRFIPACAGNTFAVRTERRSSPVHPRVRGEHPRWAQGSCIRNGSSPRARGTHPETYRRAQSRRFIPACAGNTLSLPPSPLSLPVHPRVRGEHLARGAFRVPARGSSPRARGTLPDWLLKAAVARFIPACAGNTRDRRTPIVSPSVHPRVRGEHIRSSAYGAPARGSSPRARGTPPYPWRSCRRRRFIPACAGNTTRAFPSRREAPVHPRVRGEHGTVSLIEPIPNGSSPRARGTRMPSLPQFETARFIPACAGNTS